MTTSAPRPIDQAHWQARLSELAATHRVPAASLAILRMGSDSEADEIAEAVYGLESKATGREATNETAFQIGSIGKVWTGTVIMQLVEQGKIDLDAPVRDLLPDLELSDPEVAATVTVRHLLTHTSGIDGDVFTDTGRGDDCLEKYVATLADVPQNHPLGSTFSYCNTGFTLLGRIIEVVTGQVWDTAMRERIFVPLGLTHTTTLPEEAILGRAAVGHIAEPGEDPHPTPRWLMQRSAGPAGLINSTALELCLFARMHLAGGVGIDGTRIISAETVSAMQQLETELPDGHTLGNGWGLSWILFDWDGHKLIGHDGSTLGQAAFLRVLPEQGLVVALLTNGGNARDLYVDVYREIFADLAGVRMPAPLVPPDIAPEIDSARYVGVYERTSVRTEILQREGGLRLRATSTGPLSGEEGVEDTHEYDLVPVEVDLFAIRAPGTVNWVPVTYYQLDDGTPYLHYGVRANPKRA